MSFYRTGGFTLATFTSKCADGIHNLSDLVFTFQNIFVAETFTSRLERLTSPSQSKTVSCCAGTNIKNTFCALSNGALKYLHT